MSYDQPIGSIFVQPCQRLAGLCAHRIMDYQSARAVTLDPDGRVFVEPVDHAAEIDLVGVFTHDLGVLELSRRIHDELLAEKNARGMVRRKRRSPARAIGRGVAA